MLAAEALRLAAVEVLRPTAALAADSGYPTLARWRVYDSQVVPVEDIDQDGPYTPTLCLYSTDVRVTRRGAASDPDDADADVRLMLVAELSERASAVDPSSGTAYDYADAMAETSAEARLVLAALVSQARYALEYAAAGLLWRRIAHRVVEMQEHTHAAPELGLRWCRVTLTYTVEMQPDDFSGTGLPEPLASLAAALPAGSYAGDKLAALAAQFARDDLTPLAAIHIRAGVGRMPDAAFADAEAEVDTTAIPLTEDGRALTGSGDVLTE